MGAWNRKFVSREHSSSIARCFRLVGGKEDRKPLVSEDEEPENVDVFHDSMQ
jgi:hypothetical protein